MNDSSLVEQDRKGIGRRKNGNILYQKIYWREAKMKLCYKEAKEN
jgi:hypothetical protein